MTSATTESENKWKNSKEGEHASKEDLQLQQGQLVALDPVSMKQSEALACADLKQVDSTQNKMLSIVGEDDPDEPLDSNSKQQCTESKVLFRLLRGPTILVLHTALRVFMVNASIELDADTATIEQLQRAREQLGVEEIMEETLEEEFEQASKHAKMSYKKFHLKSIDVSHYSSIFRMFFKGEYNKCSCLGVIKKLRFNVAHCIEVSSFELEKSLYKAVDQLKKQTNCPSSEGILQELTEKLPDQISNIKFEELDEKDITATYNRALNELLPDSSEVLLALKEETAALNKCYSKNNVLTLTQQLQTCQYTEYATFTDVFITPLLMFNEKPLKELSEIFSDLEALGISSGNCTGLRAFFLSGYCGAGKSTLAHRLVQSWLDGSSPSLVKFQVVFLVELQRARNDDIFSYLKDCMPGTMKDMSSDNFIQFFSEFSILLVIDGFDARYPLRFQLLKNIRKCFSKSAALITTSNDCLSAAQSLFTSVADSARPVVKVCGFDQGQCKDFANKMLAVVKSENLRTELSEKFELVMNHRQSLFPCQRESPLVACLTMVILILNPSVSEHCFESKPKLWNTFFSSLFPEAESSRTKSVDDELLLRIGEVCLRMLQSDGRLEISSEDRKGADLNDSNLSILCMLKNDLDSSSENDRSDIFSFCTASSMHYLAAIVIIKEVTNDQRSLHSYFRHDNRLFKELLPFLVRDTCLLKKNGLEIFDIAVDVKKTSSSGDIYSFWYDIFSQMDLNSNHVLHECVTKVFRDHEWNLRKETLVPAAGILKLCKPGVTEELSINLTGSDSSSNAVLMQHMCECLRQNYNNGASQTSLSLDLGLSDVEASCTWLEVLEKPFLRLVDFTGHVDAESVLVLRDCKRLSSVTLRLSSVDSFNNFTKCYETSRQLKTVKLHVSFLDSLPEIPDGRVKRLSSKTKVGDLSFQLIFEGLESQLLNKFFIFMRDILPSPQYFFRLVLTNTSLDLADAREILSTKFFEDGIVAVTSSCRPSQAEKEALKADLFKEWSEPLEWPPFQFEWNGRPW